MNFYNWISNNYIEVFGAVTGILYVILEIRQNIWLWPVGIITSAVYIWVFLTGKLYADMGLQGYYLVISVMGWYWWLKGAGLRAQGSERRGQDANVLPSLEGQGVGNKVQRKLPVTNLRPGIAIKLSIVFVVIFFSMWLILDRLTDSPVPAWDSFITSLSIIATWMLARKIYEHWFLWIVVNVAAALLFYTRGLYPTVILYIVYCAMSFVGLVEWKKTLKKRL
jgi:nicotinamide mononucleotide transporter